MTRKPKKKRVLGVFKYVLLSAVVAGVLAAGYIGYIKLANYFIFHSQKQENSLIAAKFTLQERKTAFVQYSRLDPLSQEFYQAKERVWAVIKGNEDISNEKLGDLIGQVKSQESKDLLKKAARILDSQKSGFLIVDEYNTLVKDIYIFQPERDLLSEDWQITTNNISSARSGLGSIRQKLSEKYSLDSIEKVLDKLDECLDELVDLENKAEKGTTPLVADIDRFSALFWELRSLTFEYERALLFNDEMLNLITEQSNLLQDLQQM